MEFRYSELSPLTVSIAASAVIFTLVHVVSSIIAVLAIASRAFKSISSCNALELISSFLHALECLFGAVVGILCLVLLLFQTVIVGPQRILPELFLKNLLIHC